ncbi:MAG: DHH family phosphoesterase [Clostridia bacterium]|nr:DHH family phosphoesterase [Clostridia bacterium]
MDIFKYVPFPACLVDKEGRIIAKSESLEAKDSFFELTRVKMQQLEDIVDKDEYLLIERNDKKYRLRCVRDEEDNIYVHFIDVTPYENLKSLYNEERMCVVIVNVDNYDEIVSTNAEINVSKIVSSVDQTIRTWAAKLKSSVNKLANNQYIIFVSNKELEQSVQDKFPILDQIRKIGTESDFPVTLSLGVGIGGKSILETEDYATIALDLALGRGGAQAVVKRGSKIEYFGGTLQSVEKGNKGKSRIVAHALKQLIRQADKVFIMAHPWPDMDAFGASLGINKMCELEGKEAYIVINEYNEALSNIYNAAKEKEKYNFINNRKAQRLAGSDSLVVVLDTNRRSLVECPELLEKTEKIALIDHHRKVEDYIDNAALSYVESYASSTCELVAEMIQAIAPKKVLDKFEAEAMLAGMTIDTNRFAVKTGVRTFEAASWLRRSGADTTEVKKYFQTNMEDFVKRAKSIAGASFFKEKIAFSICEGNSQNAQVICSQVADELLSVKGIKATFVLGKDLNGRTVISARSLGEINVQLIMEAFGGGGHLTTAGAQVDMSPEEAIEKLKEIVKEKVFKEGK